MVATSFKNPEEALVTLPSVEEHVITSASSTLDMLSLLSVTWERVRTATASDDDMQALVTIIEAGMPESKNELPEQLRRVLPISR